MSSTIPPGDAPGGWPVGGGSMAAADAPPTRMAPGSAAVDPGESAAFQRPTSHVGPTLAVSFAEVVPAPAGHRSIGTGISRSTTDCLAAFQQGAGKGWCTLAFASAGNGGREVLVAVPPGVDLAKPIAVVTYLHGLYSRIGMVMAGSPDPANTDGNVSAEMAAFAKGPPARNVVFVLPEMKSNQAYVDDPGALSGNKGWLGAGESLTQVVADALSHLRPIGGQPLNVSQYAVIGHSFGGKAIANALSQGTMPPGAHISVIDGTYYAELPDLLARHASAHPQARVTVTFFDGSPTAGIGNAVKAGRNVVVTHVPKPQGSLLGPHMRLAHEHFARGIPALP